MRRFFRYLFLRPVLWASNKFSSRPDKQRVFEALDKLRKDILEHPGKRGLVVPFDLQQGRLIIFSDQHKGAGNGADDFAANAANYMAALQYYEAQQFFLVCLGDSEELWENLLTRVKKTYANTFEAEKKFVERDAFVKVIGNHDLFWTNDPLAGWQLKNLYGRDLKAYDGIIFTVPVNGKVVELYCTHGHQGDKQSDGNWFSKFFVSWIWGPLQSLLRINPNTAAFNTEKKTLHNEMMYEWSSHQKDCLLITGHTHQPVFVSLTHIERLYKKLQKVMAEKNEAAIAAVEKEIRLQEKNFKAVSLDYMGLKPSYFNSGCCCFMDGDITGIEISEGMIRLVKWTSKNDSPYRVILEETPLTYIAAVL